MRGQGEIEIPEEIQNEKPEPSSHFTFITETLKNNEKLNYILPFTDCRLVFWTKRSNSRNNIKQ